MVESEEDQLKNIQEEKEKMTEFYRGFQKIVASKAIMIVEHQLLTIHKRKNGKYFVYFHFPARKKINNSCSRIYGTSTIFFSFLRFFLSFNIISTLLSIVINLKKITVFMLTEMKMKLIATTKFSLMFYFA